ncbi:MAG: bacteriochlorophyll 4-vinyl reductase [Paracoccaceae bacterium]|uniref:bacteriochlorophyll 4-vinyl reductase n=1 Tax=Seohaeicola saemankumensis TaxID=481181 RepID=UPI001E501932|nr:bacteriochlorophyll 4-vinyl reductase [Seohaeicola saemankumensis]MCD1627139.1 bacteriochlorophyll 4-vinyl reductase [Seohaeicola saemankumensis]
MTAPTAGLLRAPRRKGMMGSQTVLPLVAAIERRLGQDTAARLLDEARFTQLPKPGEPVRERQVAVLHQSLRREYPDLAEAIQREAARDAVDWLMQNRIPARARLLLSGMPWGMAVWMLGRNAAQNSWTFSGSGKFSLLSTSEFQMIDNPLIRGERSNGPVCAWHEELLQHTFRRMAHSRLSCVETSCMATGADACRFRLSMDPVLNTA